MATEAKATRRAYIYEEDIIPRTTEKKPTKEYKITWSRQSIGRFIQEQMFWRGYFVSTKHLNEVQPSRDMRGRFINETTLRHPSGNRKTERGVWAVGQLAYRAEIGQETILRMMKGDYKRGPFFFSLIKVLRALGVDLVGIPAKDTSVAMIVKGW